MIVTINTSFKKESVLKLKYYMIKVLIINITVVAFVLVSCNTYKNNITYKYRIQNNEINYYDFGNWAAHPLKKDNSDSVSNIFSENVNIDLADIFFLHPTSFTDERFRYEKNGSLEDEELNKKTDDVSILYQSTIFNEIGRVYAPRYRQAHIQRYYDTGSRQEEAFKLAYTDIKKAFQTYLEQWNDGRLIIIASHSQGTTHAQTLLKELIDGKELANRVVFLYLLGMPVKKGDYITIKPCVDDSTNFCYVSWRTFRKGYEGKYTSVKDTTVQVNNPVNIYAGSNWATLTNKKRAILWDFSKGYEKTHDSRVMGNMLWITRPKFKGGLLGFFIKNYHAGDFNLYYEDIREDIKKRLIHELTGK